MSYNNFNPNTNLETFRTNIGRFQPPHSYAASFVYMNNYKVNEIMVYPDSITLPSIHVNSIEYGIWGNPVSIPSHTSTGNMLISFILLDDWGAEAAAPRQFFENWIETIQNPSFPGTTTAPPASYENSYGSATIIFYKNREETQTYYIAECYPMELTPVEFSAGSSGYTIFSVVFYVRNIQAAHNLSTTFNINQIQRTTTP